MNDAAPGLNFAQDPEPWPDPVSIADVLDAIVESSRKYLILEEYQRHAVALWVTQTYTFKVNRASPLLLINAPERACAKSLLLEFICLYVSRPLSTANTSVAAVFRVVEAVAPTILVDEADTFFKERSELHGIFNSGYSSSGYVLRTEAFGDDFRPRSYSTYCPKALAGIALDRHLPDATWSRGLEIKMRRKLPSERVERFRGIDQRLTLEIKRKLQRFAVDSCEQLAAGSALVLPDSLSDRAQDNWEPLLAIAGVAGDEWLKLANVAAIEISGRRDNPAGAGNELLSDIREVFTRDRLTSMELIERLCADPEAGWATYNRGKPVTPRQLAGLLSPYGLAPRTVRQGDKTPKGYLRNEFTPVYERYLPPAADAPQHTDDEY